jgi:hypothetical protein
MRNGGRGRPLNSVVRQHVTTQPVHFDAHYTGELIWEATHAFQRYRFGRYGKWLAAACVVNTIGFAFAFGLGGNSNAVLAAIAFFVVLAPVWLLYEHFIWPSRHAAKLGKLLPEHVRMTISSEALSAVLREQDAVIPWSIVTAVLETKAFFLLVISPFAFVLVPRSHLPREAYEVLQAKSGAGAA